jgi:hypothetical protein
MSQVVSFLRPIEEIQTHILSQKLAVLTEQVLWSIKADDVLVH